MIHEQNYYLSRTVTWNSAHSADFQFAFSDYTSVVFYGDRGGRAIDR